MRTQRLYTHTHVKLSRVLSLVLAPFSSLARSHALSFPLSLAPLSLHQNKTATHAHTCRVAQLQ